MPRCRGGRLRHLPPSAVPRQKLDEHFAGNFVFVADEAQLQKPASEGVFGVICNRAGRAGGFAAERLCADGEAQLDVGQYLLRVECAVEGTELDGVRGALR